MQILPMDEHTKQGIDVLSVAAVVASLLELVPAVTAVLSLIYVCIRIYETKTVQRWFGRHE